MKREKERQMLVGAYLDLYNMAHAMLRDDEDARDVVQEALTRTLARWRRGDALQYCKTVLYHECINVLRRRKQTVLLTELEALRLHAAEVEQLALEAASALPPAMRALVEMHDIDGFTYGQLATITGLPLATVHRLVCRAHDIIKNNINTQQR